MPGKRDGWSTYKRIAGLRVDLADPRMRSMTRALFEAVCAHELEVANRVDSRYRSGEPRR